MLPHTPWTERLRPHRVEDIYRPSALTVDAGAPLDEVACRMRDSDTGAVLVSEGRKAVGILTERDLVRAISDGVDCTAARAGDYMTADPAAVGLGTDLHEVAELMLELEVRHLLVQVDSEVVGMVSARDMLEMEAVDRDGQALTTPPGRHAPVNGRA